MAAIGAARGEAEGGYRTIVIRPNRNGTTRTIDAEIEAALATLKARGGGLLHIRAGEYTISRRHFLPSNVTVRGDGRAATKLTVPGGAPAGFVVGYQRVPAGGTTIPPGHHFELFGKLDTSAASAANQKFGLATRDQAFVGTPNQPGQATCIRGFPAGPLAMGPYKPGVSPPTPTFWQDVRHLTIEFGLDAADTGKVAPTDVSLFGSILAPQNGARAQPVCVFYQNATNVVKIVVTTGTREAPVNSHYQFTADTTASAVQKYVAMIDLEAGTVSAGVGTGTTVTRLATTLSSGPGLLPGEFFCSNSWSYFMIGGGTKSPSAIRNFVFGGTTEWPDFKLCGLHYTWGRVYTLPAVGQPMAREDGQAVNDARRFFGGNTSANVALNTGSGTIAYLPLTDKPYNATTAPYDAYEPLVQHGLGAGDGGYTTRGFAYHGTGITTNNHLAQYAHIEDLTIFDGLRWGAPVWIGSALYCTLSGVGAIGGWYGVGALDIGANYFNTVRDCMLQASDVALFGSFAYFYVSQTLLAYSGRYSALMLGSNSSFTDILSGSGKPYTIANFLFRGGGGGQHHALRNVNCNEENANSPLVAQVIMENTNDSDGDTLHIDGLSTGKIGPDACLVKIIGVGSGVGWPPAHAIIENLSSVAIVTNMVVVDDPHGIWAGVVRGRTRGGATAIYHVQTQSQAPGLWTDQTVPY